MQRSEISEAISDSIEADLTAHEKTIAEYAVETKTTAFDHRAELIGLTMAQVHRLRHLILPDTQAALRCRSEEIQSKLADAKRTAEKAQESVKAANVGRGRRIVGVGK